MIFKHYANDNSCNKDGVKSKVEANKSVRKNRETETYLQQASVNNIKRNHLLKSSINGCLYFTQFLIIVDISITILQKLITSVSLVMIMYVIIMLPFLNGPVLHLLLLQDSQLYLLLFPPSVKI